MASSKTPTFYDIDIDGDQSEGKAEGDHPKEVLPPKLLKLKELAKSLEEHRIDPRESRVSSALQKNRKQLAVKIENVAFSYKKNKPILKNITLYVPEGECKLGYSWCQSKIKSFVLSPNGQLQLKIKNILSAIFVFFTFWPESVSLLLAID